MSPQIYNAPPSSASTIGTQIRTDYFVKKALIEQVKETYFGQLADTTAMPKNMGKTIKRYHYMPMLDDLNTNDQGIDASGVTMLDTQRFVTFPKLIVAATNATKVAATATINANIDNAGSAATVAVAGADDSGGTGFATITLTKRVIKYATATTAANVVALNLGVTVQVAGGNMYGSSKDVGTIAGKLPALSETGGRVNRVGFKRIELTGTLKKFGFFDEYTQESLDFDSDDELDMHVNREMLRGANELTEDALQIDLLGAAGVVYYGGIVATSDATMTGVGVEAARSEVNYEDLMKLAIELDNNRCPKNTKIITGSQMTDTKVVNAARIMYIGSEVQPTIEKMKDHFGAQAFIPVAKYAAAGSLINGEIGTVGSFRICVVPEMMHWAGVGAAEGVNAGFRATNGRYDVFPMLVVGSESFTTIGFQTDGKSTKFKIINKKPGEATADKTDPFGETGFMSIKWYYGFMALRPERIAVLKTIAQQ